MPSELFEAVLRVAKEKNCEVIKSRNGVYVVQYSESGPWKEQSVAGEYLPVWIMLVQSWSSGGIKINEMAEYLNSKENDNDEV